MSYGGFGDASTNPEMAGNNLVTNSVPVISSGNVLDNTASGNMLVAQAVNPQAGQTMQSFSSSPNSVAAVSPNAAASPITSPWTSPSAAPTGGNEAYTAKYAPLSPENQNALFSAAQSIGANPDDLYAVINKETGGTFDPSQRGGTDRKFLGLIQFGPQEQKPQAYNISPNDTFEYQVNQAAKFLQDRGWQPGMGLAHMYSIINAGSLNPNQVGPDGFLSPRWNANDRRGTPGYTVRDHVADIQANWMPGDINPVGTAAVANPETAVASSLPSTGTLKESDVRAGYAPSTATSERPVTPAQENTAIGSMSMPPAQWQQFQADLNAGKVPWDSLPGAWQAALTAKLGTNAQTAYEAERAKMASAQPEHGAAQAATTAGAPVVPVSAESYAPSSSPSADSAAGQSSLVITPTSETSGILSGQTPATPASEVPATPVAGEDIAPTPMPTQRPLRRGDGYKTNDTTKNAVTNLQSVLQSQGLYPIQIDGKFGPVTQRGVRAFQKQNGMAVTGMADAKTMAAIGQVANQTSAGRMDQSNRIQSADYNNMASANAPGREAMAALGSPEQGAGMPFQAQPSVTVRGRPDALVNSEAGGNRPNEAAKSDRLPAPRNQPLSGIITPIQQFLVDHGIVSPDTVGLQPSEPTKPARRDLNKTIPPAVNAPTAAPSIERAAFDMSVHPYETIPVGETYYDPQRNIRRKSAPTLMAA